MSRWPSVLAVLLFSATAAAAPPPTVLIEPGTPPGRAVAIFAGGCFWCMTAPFEKLPGVDSVTAGYTGGSVAAPTYEQVSSGTTGHAESVRIVYDPKQVDYPKLLDVFWHSIDPTTPRRQFCDSGDQYRTAIFTVGAEQQKQAIASKEALAASGVLKAPIVTEIIPATRFWPAEEYHQDYYKKEELRYQIYRHACGRDRRLKDLYGDKAAVEH